MNVIDVVLLTLNYKSTFFLTTMDVLKYRLGRLLHKGEVSSTVLQVVSGPVFSFFPEFNEKYGINLIL